MSKPRIREPARKDLYDGELVLLLPVIGELAKTYASRDCVLPNMVNRDTLFREIERINIRNHLYNMQIAFFLLNSFAEQFGNGQDSKSICSELPL